MTVALHALNNVLSSFDILHIPFEYTRVNLLTGTTSAIDHIFVSSCLSVRSKSSSAVSFSDHDALYLALDLPKPTIEPTSFTFRDFGSVDIDALRNEITAIDWTVIRNSTNLDFKVEHLTGKLNSLQEMFVPERVIFRPDPNTPWLSSHLLKLQNDRELAYKLWRNRRNRRKGDALWVAYCKIRNKTNTTTSILKRNFLRRKFNPHLPAKTLFKNFRSQVCMNPRTAQFHLNLTGMN